jgi:hypothetical protein
LLHGESAGLSNAGRPEHKQDSSGVSTQQNLLEIAIKLYASSDRPLANDSFSLCCKPPRNPVTRAPQNIRKPPLTNVHFSGVADDPASRVLERSLKRELTLAFNSAQLRQAVPARYVFINSRGNPSRKRERRSRKREISFVAAVLFPNSEKPTARPCEARHYGADRHIRSLGNLAIGQPMKIS